MTTPIPQTLPKNALDLTERDFVLLRGLFECRVMTLAHAAALYFNGSTHAAKKRVQKLKAVRMVSERPRPRQYDPSILFLSKRGFELLRRQGRLSDYPAIGAQTMEKRVRVSPLTLRHELEVMTVKAAMVASLRMAGGYTVNEFNTWPRLISFVTQRHAAGSYGNSLLIRPDGFLQIAEKDQDGFGAVEHLFYLELDRSTETHGDLLGRAAGYIEHYRGGGMAARFGGPKEAFKKHPFRVLWVFRNEERRNNAAVALLRHRPPIFTMMWLTTFDEAVAHPLEPIWVRPLDYQRATQGTRFDPHIRPADLIYRRQAEREELVARKIVRQRLFTGPIKPMDGQPQGNGGQARHPAPRP